MRTFIHPEDIQPGMLIAYRSMLVIALEKCVDIHITSHNFGWALLIARTHDTTIGPRQHSLYIEKLELVEVLP